MPPADRLCIDVLQNRGICRFKPNATMFNLATRDSTEASSSFSNSRLRLDDGFTDGGTTVQLVTRLSAKKEAAKIFGRRKTDNSFLSPIMTVHGKMIQHPTSNIQNALCSLQSHRQKRYGLDFGFSFGSVGVVKSQRRAAV
jgi:hypothetical protein